MFSFLSWLWRLLCDWCSCLFTTGGGGQGGRMVSFPRSGRVVRCCEVAGEGAFSFVFTAQETNSSRAEGDAGSGKHFALKKMLLQSPDLARCAQSEVSAFARFQHHSILPLLDSVTLTETTTSGSVKVMYLLFPLMERGSLRQVLNSRLDASRRSLPPLVDILTDFVSICEALNVLHTYKPSYVHQDLKPENILIGADWRPYLMDFGSVRLAEVPIKDRSKALRVADEAASYSTVSYRAPELFDPPTGLLLDTRTDVWAAGCLLFAWYYGYSPYECEFAEDEKEDNTGPQVGRARLRIVESSHSRVLSAPPERPSATATREDVLLAACVAPLLRQDMSDRPFLTDVIVQLNEVISKLQQGDNFHDSDEVQV